ncbi:hypothetical protein B0H34DRAFT_809325 [Crassisporium funariophilum]|nr:hypothetical protein B0H34DRAFT_809325 [Crassisporium funariophilum]
MDIQLDLRTHLQVYFQHLPPSALTSPERLEDLGHSLRFRTALDRPFEGTWRVRIGVFRRMEDSGVGSSWGRRYIPSLHGPLKLVIARLIQYGFVQISGMAGDGPVDRAHVTGTQGQRRNESCRNTGEWRGGDGGWITELGIEILCVSMVSCVPLRCVSRKGYKRVGAKEGLNVTRWYAPRPLG